MRRLVIDTASRACSVALFENMECIAACHEVIGRGHAERLVPMIAELPDRGKADIISVNVGPGSFTGIRVGISAARGLAFAWNAPCEGYGCLDLIAAMARAQLGVCQAVDVAIGGGHGEVFFQSFAADGQSIAGPQSLLPAQAAKLSTAALIAGDAAANLVALRKSGEAVEIFADARAWQLLPRTVMLSPTPVYVRGADAKLPGGISP